MEQNIYHWSLFFEEWKKTQIFDPIQKWQQYFNDFHRLSIPNASQPSPISTSEWAVFFQGARSSYTEHRKKGLGINFWHVAGIGKDELKNSTVLAWLLDYYGSHGQRDAFLQCFLTSVKRRYATTGVPTDHFPASSDISGDYRTNVEQSYDEHEAASSTYRSRIDIKVDGPGFLLLIEIKINASETGDQLARYLRVGKQQAGTRPSGVVFITKEGRLPNDTSLHDKVICLSWRELSAEFLRHTNSMPVESYGRTLIEQFCRHMALL